MLIRDIYQEKNSLREMTAQQRFAVRSEKVAPKVDAFFEYIHSLEDSDGILSDRMKTKISDKEGTFATIKLSRSTVCRISLAVPFL